MEPGDQRSWADRRIKHLRTAPMSTESKMFFASSRYPDGSAHNRPQHTSDHDLTEVGPGSPCGELMRRYWQPFAQSADLTTTPKNLRILGEDLIMFRDASGRPGVLTPRCIHRGTSLYYGKVDAHGIRCCYHGWQFDVEGRCIDQPCEPAGSTFKEKCRQPWYPVEERYGLAFVYMGPPQRKPLLPKWDILEGLRSDESLTPIGPSGFGVGGDASVKIVPWSWLQDYENTMDPFHVPILHASFTEVHFTPEMAIMPHVSYEQTPLGMHYRAHRSLDDGRKMDRVSPCIFPNVRSVPDVKLKAGLASRVGWVVPVDADSHLLFHVVRHAQSEPAWPVVRGRVWSEMSEEEKQKFPSDWEAQLGQGAVTLHSEERLGVSDKGIIMLRKLLKQQMHIVKDGGDPIGLAFKPEDQVMTVGSGNYYL
jgi:phenylpropionate dioxygenase-like ring-hydroxylating dioxygenase large terminal subunit